MVTLLLYGPLGLICCGLVSGQDWLHLDPASDWVVNGCGLVSGQDWLHLPSRDSNDLPGCGLVSGQDWLHFLGTVCIQCIVADWSQAKIGYTLLCSVRFAEGVADWSQAKIGYTSIVKTAPKKPLRIGLRPRLVTLSSLPWPWVLVLRIGLRPRLVTLSGRTACGG